MFVPVVTATVAVFEEQEWTAFGLDAKDGQFGLLVMISDGERRRFDNCVVGIVQPSASLVDGMAGTV